MFDQVFDIHNPFYAIYAIFDLAAHVERMRERHPDWSEAQLLCVLYWQSSAKKALNVCVDDFITQFRKEGFYITNAAEAMGVNLTQTMQNAGIMLEWPARKNVYKIAIAGIPLDNRHLNILK
jgi:hypothetical protein